VSKEWQKVQKTVRECFLCRKTGHFVRDYPQRKNGDQESKISDNDHHKTVLCDQKGCQSLRLDTQLDTGSPVSFIKASVVPEEFIADYEKSSNSYKD